METKPLSLIELQRLDNLKTSDFNWIKARMRSLNAALIKAQEELDWSPSKSLETKGEDNVK